MLTRFKTTWLLLAALSASYMMPIPGRTTGSKIDSESVGQFSRPRAAEVVSSLTRQILESRDSDQAQVWVFFADKGFLTKSQFETKAASIRLHPNTAKRRLRAGIDGITFDDLPVAAGYIEQVKHLGGSLHRQSRWLNAASFRVDLELIDQIAAFPFVTEVRPVMRFSGNRSVATPATVSDAPKSTPYKSAGDPLDYGPTLAQLTQLNVPALHAMGFTGQGVILALIDTGYRKSHEAFAQHYIDGRVLDEYDFIFDDSDTDDEPEDIPGQHNHGTLTWSCAGGFKDGYVYGPAYKASFLLAKTEDLASETPVEEDNWVAALEWADSLGADVVTTSLGYMVFDAPYGGYLYSDLDGATATTSIAASTAASLGIILCKSAGNSGPGSGSISTPADAFDILSVGSVNSSGAIAYSSSRGPTFDGRIKPEVCARGVGTSAASASADDAYGSASGTSFAAPLVAGVACLLVEARPDLSPDEIREAIKMSASQAELPDNTYGWGIVNALAAYGSGVSFTADQTLGVAPLSVQFTATLPATSDGWIWSFGDDDSAFVKNPLHVYSLGGQFEVRLSSIQGTDTITQIEPNYIISLADSISFSVDSAYAGEQVVLSVSLTNFIDLDLIDVVFGLDSEPVVGVDSVIKGVRTEYFEILNGSLSEPENNRYRYILQTSAGGSLPSLAAGEGEILRIYLSIDALEFGDMTNVIDTISYLGYSSELATTEIAYPPPFVVSGAVSTRHIRRGDANNNGQLNISDVTFLVDYLFGIPIGEAPVTVQAGDANAGFDTNISDITYLIDYLFGIPPGPAPPFP